MRRVQDLIYVGLMLTMMGCTESDTSTESDAEMMSDEMGMGATEADGGGADRGVTGPLMYRPCDVADHVGGIEITLEDEFTSVQGQIYNGVVPAYIPMVAQSEGTCRLLRPRALRCEPRCEVGLTCGEDGTCRPQPEAVSVGTITVDGLTAPVELSAGPPVFFYSHRGDLPHPAFGLGDRVSLSASGTDEVMAFALEGRGVEALEIQSEALPLEMGTPSVLSWTAPTDDSDAMIHLVLSIANHGGTPGQIDCEVPDTGEFTFPVALTDAILNLGYSGFPAVWLTRRTVDSVSTSLGCVELVVQSNSALDIAIPGLTSCSVDEDCPDGQTCGPDLTCGDAT